jgi:hypothetical protein
MTVLNYQTARPIPIDELEIGDQMLSPYGYRVVHDIQETSAGVEIYFWDENAITRPAGSTVTAMKRWEQS